MRCATLSSIPLYRVSSAASLPSYTLFSFIAICGSPPNRYLPPPPSAANRNITPDAPRDRSIALIAPAATALCLVLARLGCKESAGASGIRMTLFEVLAACMKDAVDLMARVLDAAGRLGQAVNLER